MSLEMKNVSIEDPPSPSSSPQSTDLKDFLAKNKQKVQYGGAGTAAFALVVVVIIVIAASGGRQNPSNFRSRIDCLPWLKSKKVSASECARLPHCTYAPVDNNVQVPSCYMDKNAFRSSIIEAENNSMHATYRIKTTYAGHNNDKNSTNTTNARSFEFKLEFNFLSHSALEFKIYPTDSDEYIVLIKKHHPERDSDVGNLYEIEVDNTGDFFSFKIRRTSTKTVIWDSSLGPIIFEKYNRLIATRLPSINVYGMGENRHETLRHDLNYKNWAVWARDEPPEFTSHANLYGAQPFYTCLESDGNSHGVLLVNSNAFDYELVPTPGMVYRVTGGILHFYVFLGPEPENVIQQYTLSFGRTFFPPYWALGFQISRYGYRDLNHMNETLNRFLDNEIPLDTQVADIDHYDQRRDFTIDQQNWQDLPTYFDYIHSLGMKTVMILDPAVVVNDTSYWPYADAKDKDIFIKWPNNMNNIDANETNSSFNIMLGYVSAALLVAIKSCWPTGKVAYPDFFKKEAQNWWIESIEKHHKTLKFDGLWIDMNEPAVFGTNEERPFNWPEDAKPYWSLKCPDNDTDELVKTKASYLYRSDNKLSDKTLCMSGVQGENNEYTHFNVHNMYGLMESIPTYSAARRIASRSNNIDNGDARGFVITRSTFIGSGQYGGHWTGDNHALWKHMHYSIIGMLEFNMFGIPYVGSDICGFWLNTTVELCARWSALGAFYPFSRNHNGEGNIDQDPAALGPDVVAAAKNALFVRYQLLPYYYTLFYNAHVYGNTVVRPLFHEFPLDENTYGIDEQFLVGPAVLITPVLRELATSVKGYLPAGIWYDYYTGQAVRVDSNNTTTTTTTTTFATTTQEDNNHINEERYITEDRNNNMNNVTPEDSNNKTNSSSSSSNKSGRWVDMDAPLTHIPVHVRGGWILPTQVNATTSEASRRTPFTLVCALNAEGRASGDLFYDDGLSELSVNKYFYARFAMSDRATLAMSVDHDNYEKMSELKLDKVRIYAPALAQGATNDEVNEWRAKVTVNGVQEEDDRVVTCNADASLCELTNLNLSMNKQFRIEIRKL